MTQPPGDPAQPATPDQPAEPPAATGAETPPTMAPPTVPWQPTPQTQPLYLPGQSPAYPQAQPYPPSQGYPQPFPPQPTTAYLEYPPQQSPRRHRGLLIGILAGVFALLLVGGGVSAYMLTRDGGKGQASPAAAVDGFLTAVYTNQDATAAGKFVCPQARDKVKLTTKINEIKKQNSQYELPKYSWKRPVAKQGFNGPDTEAELTTVVTVRTSTEQHAEQPLTFLATRQNGWWVCEVKQGA